MAIDYQDFNNQSSTPAAPASGVTRVYARTAGTSPNDEQTLVAERSSGLVQKLVPIFNVKEFGAFGDNTADDQPAIQAAINAAVGVNGGIVFFPPGQYRIKSNILSNGTTVALNCDDSMSLTLMGASGMTGGTAAATLLELDSSISSTPIIIAARSSSGFSLRDLQLVTPLGYSGVMLSLDYLPPSGSDASNANMRRVQFAGPAAAQVSLEHAINVDLEGCLFIGGPAIGIRGGGDAEGAFANAIRVLSCTFGQTGGGMTAIPIQCKTGTAWLISGCTFESLASGAAGAIDVGLLMNCVVVEGCWMGDVAYHSSGTWITFNGNGLTVQGCFISGGDTAINFGDESVSWGLDCRGNSLFGFNTGFKLNNAGYISIRGNAINNTTTWYTETGIGVNSEIQQPNGLGLGTISVTNAVTLPNIAGPSGQGLANAWTTYSLASQKENIRPLENALEIIKRLEPIRYVPTARAAQCEQIGFLAEDVAAVLPEVVVRDESGVPIGLMYDRLTVLLTRAVSELAAALEVAGGGASKGVERPPENV